MGLSLQTNVSAMFANENLSVTQQQLSKTQQHLSSGYKVNTAADNAAGLAISEVLQSQINGLNQAGANAADASNMIQTAAGGMQQVQAMFQSMRQLAVQASNSTLGATDTAAINTQLTDLTTAINNIATSTQFNGLSVLDGSISGSLTGGTLAVGGAVGAGQVSKIDVSGAQAATYTMSTAAGGLTLTNGTTGQSQTMSAAQLAAAAVAGGATGSLNFAQLGVNISLVGGAGGGAGITAANLVGLGTAGDTVIVGGNGAATFQTGANNAAGNSVNVAFSDMSVSAGNADATTGAALAGLATALTTYSGAQNTANAQALITAVDTAISTVSQVQSNLGASQNAISFTSESLATTSQNLSQSNSAIVDVDVAKASSDMSRQNVLMQAGISVLAQANQSPQMALKLLQ